MQRLTIEQASRKIKAYCAYQERSHAEVKEKLYSYGLYKAAVEELLAELIVEGFLNEERFARQFAGGKFRMKGWGKRKIIQELKFRKISDYNIQRGLEDIDEQAYRQTLHKFAEKKWNSLKKDQYIIREAKTIRFLLQKGYELPLIKETLAEIRG